MVNLTALETPAVIVLTVCAVFILISRNWRWSLISLSIQYVGVVILILSTWPVLMSLTKLVAGWISCAVLSAAIQDVPVEEEVNQSAGHTLVFAGVHFSMEQIAASLFGLLAAGMVVLVAYSITPTASEWVPGITFHLAIGGVLLIGLGALHLGLTSQPIRVVIGLLTILSGFEIIYAAVEKSLLVAGLLSGVTLGLALVGSYLVSAPRLST